MGEPVLRIVDTFDGSKAIKGHCKFIKGEYYEINKQCFLMPDGKWHRINNGFIEFDHKYEVWRLKGETPNFYEGVVDGSPENPKLGFFSVDGNELFLYYRGRSLPILKDSLVKKLDLVEDISSGKYYTKEEAKTTKNYIGKKKVYSYNMKLDYNSETTMKFHLSKFREEGLRGFLDFHSEELDGITYGMEIETWNGTINQRHLHKVGLIPLMDGSLRHDGFMAYEYATIPLSGGEGLYTLKNAFDILQRYTTISKMCSLHLHIGGYKRSKEFVLSTYSTIKALENEIYSLFPAFYEDTSNFKQKNYCGHLPNFNLVEDTNKSFDTFYTYMSCGLPFEDWGGNHPNDANNNHKWDINTRYFITNFVPFMWGNRGTIEFRVHPPTLNPVKAISWLFIANAILRFANLHKNNWYKIYKSKLSLSDIFDTVYNPELTTYLNNYISYLKERRKVYDSIGDSEGEVWCREDEIISFKGIEKLTNLFEECPLV